MPFINFNGSLTDSKEPVIHSTNRGFHYGDGLFETMRWHRGVILFYNDHWLRLAHGLAMLKMNPDLLSQDVLLAEINKVVSKNEIEANARIRLTFYRENEGKYLPDKIEDTGYLIEAAPLSGRYKINKRGLRVGIYEEAKKTINGFSNLKTCSALLYVMAAIYAKENRFDDCLILNQRDNICEATGSNVFAIRSGVVITPSLAEGCVAGVMRKQIIYLARETGLGVVERDVLREDIEEADEVFLTNAIAGIRWVEKILNRNYSNTVGQSIAKNLG